MMNATITQQQSSNFDQGGYMSHDHSPQINKELNVDITTQSLEPENIINKKPPILQSMSADPYQQNNNNNNNNVNLTDFPILEALQQPSNVSNNSHSPLIESINNNKNIIRKQPQLRVTASAPESSYNNNNNGYQHQHQHQHQYQHQLSPIMSYQQQQQQHHQYRNNSPTTTHHVLYQQQQQYTPHRLREMYNAYKQYYDKYQQQQQALTLQQQQYQQYNVRYNNNNNNNNNQRYQQKQQQQQKQYATKSHAEYMKYLIKTVRDQTEEINQMQQTISCLQKTMGTKKLLEEDFFSFLSRIEFPDWISDEEKKLCLNKLFLNEIKKLREELETAQLSRRQEASLNLKLETKIIELTDDLSLLRDYLEQEKHKNYLDSVNHNKNLAAKLAKKNNGNNSNNNNNNNNYWIQQQKRRKNVNPRNTMDYPPENIIIQNLIRTQIEFYFSDYNLKRDKRLLDQLCSDRIGFLKIDSVMNLTRVRQLSSHRNQVINSLKHSKFLHLTTDSEWIGRIGFERPQEKQFPFRRTVFVFGLPLDCNEKYVTEMLSPFGKLSKVKFDHGPDTLDRLVAENMFKEIKVYKYRELNTRILYHYKQEIMVGGSAEYSCQKCSKIKQCDEGFYETNSYQILICLQCAAGSAEDILEKCKKNCYGNKRMIELLCGKSPRDTNGSKTALAVFTSQRQASKCVYVRSRIAFDGCFTTHYHHYSKIKKEIALTLQPYAHKLRQIPPRIVLNQIYHQQQDENENNNNCSHFDKISCDREIEKIEKIEKIQNMPPKITVCHTVPVLSSNNISVDDDKDNKSELSLAIIPGCSEIGQQAPKLHHHHHHHHHHHQAPKLKKSSAASLTAPVVGGSGEMYLMRTAYNKVITNKNNNNSSTQ